MARSYTMVPINSVFWVTQAGVKEVVAKQVTIDRVGEKAFGLSSIPSKWTLPFFAISEKLFDEYVEGQSIENLLPKWEDAVRSAAEKCGITMDDPIIVRSNSHTEGLEERGKFISVDGLFKDWPILVKQCFDDSVEQEDVGNIHMPVIVQKKATVLLGGHVSNERRVAEEIRDWSGEIETSIPRIFKISLRNWRKKVNIDGYLNSSLICPSDKNIEDVLSIPCTWAKEQRLRVHFEWVFDGDKIYIVQADEETSTKGVDPTKITCNLAYTDENAYEDFPHCVHLLDAKDEERYIKYAKIQNPLLYNRLGLNTAPLYILDDRCTLDLLSKGIVSKELELDLRVLTTHPLIIRTDISTERKEERQLLPRTDSIKNVEEAKKWLCDSYSKLAKRVQKTTIFIMHNFIPAISSAFAYASPGDKQVRIEALWGLPEGLYYYSHDKYLVDTQLSDFRKIQREDLKIFPNKNFKKYFVIPAENGEWKVQCLASPYDWKPSIPNEDWIKEIAFITRRISEEEKESLSVMWFVGVDKNRYRCDVLPWYHEPYEYNENQALPRNKLTFEKTITIHTVQDLESIEGFKQTSNANIRNIHIQPTNASFLRERSIIDRIGIVAKDIGATIVLEGGILSHAYYQLVRTGAKVEVRYAFEKRQSSEYNKLVRDKIPEKIQSNGEEAVTAELDDLLFSSLLKRKLVEEALEVLDSKSNEELAVELADILEVIDGILSQHKIDFQTVLDRKKKKREKAGGFEKGVFLKRTLNLYSNEGKIVVDKDPVDTELKVSKSTDLRKYSIANESLTKIKVPMTLEKWEIRPKVKAENLDIVLKGVRKRGVWQIDVSVFEEADQISLFDK